MIFISPSTLCNREEECNCNKDYLKYGHTHNSSEHLLTSMMSSTS